MLNLYYSDKLKMILKDFSNLTGMPLTIYDENFLCVTHTKMSSFCSYLAQNNILTEKCAHCDLKAFERCKKTKKTYIYRCHLGIIEAITPIIKNNQIIGYIMLGQVLDTNEKGDIIDSILSNLHSYLEPSFIKKQLKNISSMNISRIYSAVSIIEKLADYIVLKGFVNSHSFEFIDKLNQYIDDHISEKITIETLCRIFLVSRTTLYNLIRPYSPKGIGAYILDRRLEKSRFLLETTNLSVKEIALSVGFQDHTYFSRVYKNNYGISPYHLDNKYN